MNPLPQSITICWLYQCVITLIGYRWVNIKIENLPCWLLLGEMVWKRCPYFSFLFIFFHTKEIATRITTRMIERDATTAAVDLSVNTNSKKKSIKTLDWNFIRIKWSIINLKTFLQYCIRVLFFKSLNSVKNQITLLYC